MTRKKKGKNAIPPKNTLAENELLERLKEAAKFSNQETFDSRIQQQKKKFLKFIQKKIINVEDVILLLNVSAKLCKSKNPGILAMLQDLVHSELMKRQLDRLLLHFASMKDKSKSYFVAICCLDIFEKCLLTYPTAMLSVDMGGLQKFMKYFDKAVLNNRMDGITKKHYEICSKLRHQAVSDTTEINTRSNGIYTRHMPLQDFRRLPTIPTLNDIYPMEEIPLRPLLEVGSYESGEEYLDMQYRLIREDLIGPLREELRAKDSSPHPIYVFEDVQILYPICSHNGITFRIAFDTTDFKGFPWQYAKKLIFGSLLCFTKDDFRTCIFGVVADRSPITLSQGLFDVRFPDKQEFHSYTRGVKYLNMVECPSFFEAYKHVLDSFKELNPFSIPFSKYIVFGKTDIDMPKYLRENSRESYNISAALGSNNGLRVPVKQLIKEWNFSTDLNPSQRCAVKHAVTKEFAVVQGPPGTGKTFCALRIAHCLLQNEVFWNKEKDRPMLIVCYTNHALDQFLTGLSKYGYEKIIRVGGRLSEELSHFSLKAAVGKFREKSRRKDNFKYLRYMRNITNEARNQFANDLGPYMRSVKRYKEALRRGKLVKYLDIKHCISDEHQKYFDDHENHCTGLSISILDIFLDLCKIPLTILNNVSNAYVPESEDSQVVDVSFNEASHVDEPVETDLIDVYGEGNALEDRWVFDPDEYKPIETEYTVEDGFSVTEKKQDLFVDNEGFRLVTKSKSQTQREVVRQLNNVVAMDASEAACVKNPWKLSLTDKWRLYKYWLNIFLENYNEFIELRMQQYEDTCQEVTRIREEEHEIVLKQASVIAMTTTCAGRYRHVLRRIQPRVVIVEEAAEVLEAHVLTSLVKEVQHCILIGDHKQLRPNPSLYELAKNFNLELSLFERMVNNGMECPMLDVQHRMRPEISLPLRHIYPELKDSASVFQYETIKGVASNVYFIDHSFPERFARMGSKANIHEAKFIKSLCLYFLLQGYDASQITVLTGYSGQLMQLRNIMPRWLFEGVRVTTVDNFQGEENDIILLSLVRSNTKGSIGFLGIENRICVALSRAKKGFYVIGNFDLLRSKSNLWNAILDDMDSMGCIGPSLTLICQNHPNTSTEVATDKDFDMVPEGGCNLRCNFVLRCGHICHEYCHPYDPLHEEYVCKEKCLKKVCDVEEHACEVRCHFGEDCPPCNIPVEKYFPLCDHLCDLPCSVMPGDTFCKHPCENVLECGHACPKLCGEECIASEFCIESTEKSLKCNHTQMIKCNKNTSHAICTTECKFILECGHTCQGNCYECYTGNFHEKCKERCKRILPCLHQCQSYCGIACPPCDDKLCVQQSHDTAQSTEVSKSTEKCLLHLSCGHICSSLTEEPCFCLPCQFSLPESENAFIKLDCQHVFPVEAIDEIVEKVNCSNIVELAKCPDCEQPIRSVNRYRDVFTRFTSDIKAIITFTNNREQRHVSRIAEKAYETCREIAKTLIKNKPKEISNRDLTDFHTIVSNASLKDFQNNLDLRYLARTQSKSYLLLLTERLVSCRYLIDAHRIRNQTELLLFVFRCIHYTDTLLGRDYKGTIISRFTDILPDLCDPGQTFQEARDLFFEIKSVVLLINVAKCANEADRLVKTNGHSAVNRNKNIAENSIAILTSENLVSSAQYKSTLFTTKRLSQELNIQLFNPQEPILQGRTYDTLFLGWRRCDNHHIFHTTAEERKNFTGKKKIRCPKCNQRKKTDKNKNDQVVEMMDSLSL